MSKHIFTPYPLNTMAHKHFTRLQRERIETYLNDGQKQSYIATKLGKTPSTISREITNNSITGIGYIAEFAHYHAKHRRTVANQPRRVITADSPLELYIFDRLRARWSPEDIHIKLLEQSGLPVVSCKTIYTYIKEQHPEFLQYFTVLSRRKRKAKHGKRHELITNRVWIDERPIEAQERETIGHWEGDTIVSGCRKAAICTLVDRMSDFIMADLMVNRTAGELNRVAIGKFKQLPAHALKTCTYDNGPEFAGHQKLSASVLVPVYFAHPYHSWERPVNERMNRELRRFFPKGTRFKEIEQWELDWAVNLINHKPRRRLQNRTPHEVFHERLKVAF